MTLVPIINDYAFYLCFPVTYLICGRLCEIPMPLKYSVVK